MIGFPNVGTDTIPLSPNTSSTNFLAAASAFSSVVPCEGCVHTDLPA
jgi:hypothetical protein